MAKVAIKKALQDMVKANPNIKEVYFDKEGNHYFQKHKVNIYEPVGDGTGKGPKEVWTLPGVKDNILKIKVGKEMKDKKVHVEYNAIAATVSREEILETEAVLPTLSAKEENDILAQAAAIFEKRGVASYSKIVADSKDDKGKGK